MHSTNRSGNRKSYLDQPISTQSSIQTFVVPPYASEEEPLLVHGVRIFGPKGMAAQDLEPESVTISSDSKTAYVTLQRSNAVAVVGLAPAKAPAQAGNIHLRWDSSALPCAPLVLCEINSIAVG
jgi:hypothetical protein